MLVDEMVEVRWGTRNKKHFEQLGYVFTKVGDVFSVSASKLNKGNPIVVNTICDFCGENVKKAFCDYYKQTNNGELPTCCKDCQPKKAVITWITKYGETNPNKSKTVRDKIDKTNTEKYGGKSPMCSEEVKEKSKETNLEKYGVEYYSQTDTFAQQLMDANMRNFGVPHTFQAQEIREKSKLTNLEKYGVENYSQTKEYKEKHSKWWEEFKDTNEYFEWRQRIENTNLNRYGAKNPLTTDEIKQKAIKTLSENGNTPTSTQQKHIHNIIKGELNYPFGRCSLDIAFPSDMIYLEYDGGGHNLSVKLGQVSQEDFDKKERNRSFFLKDNGWREIRIISDEDKLPSDKTIVDFVEIAKSFIIADKWFSAHWNIDENFVKVNYKYIHSLEEFFTKYKTKEVI